MPVRCPLCSRQVATDGQAPGLVLMVPHYARPHMFAYCWGSNMTTGEAGAIRAPLYVFEPPAATLEAIDL